MSCCYPPEVAPRQIGPGKEEEPFIHAVGAAVVL